MKIYTYIPSSKRCAGRQIRLAANTPIERLSKPDFIRAWSSLFYLFPGLHPDGYECASSGWTSFLRRFAAEAWRRASNGRLAEQELYQSDAQWAGLYDQMHFHSKEATKRRKKLAALYGEKTHA